MEEDRNSPPAAPEGGPQSYGETTAQPLRRAAAKKRGHSGERPAVVPVAERVHPTTRTLIKELINQFERRSMAQQLWDTVLTDREKAKLGGSLDEAIRISRGGAISLYSVARGLPYALAAVQVGRLFRRVTADTMADAVQDLREHDPAVAEALRPPEAPEVLPEEVEEELREALCQSTLVLLITPEYCRMYWDGQCIMVDWRRHARSWEFLLAVTKATSAGSKADRNVLSVKKNGRLNSQRENFKRALQKTLAESGTQKIMAQLENRDQGYCWKLDPRQISIIKTTAENVEDGYHDEAEDDN